MSTRPNRECLPRHLCNVTIEKFEEPKEKIKTHIEIKPSPSIMSAPSKKNEWEGPPIQVYVI
jgi:hypothetical protein